VFGIQFRPGGTYPFFRSPTSEIQNALLWRSTLELHGAVLLSQSINLESSSIEEQFCRIPHKVSVGEVMKEIGLRQRRFIELFSDQVGLTPKAFGRVRRFQRILETVHRKSEVNWVGVALDCGYYDQPHFIHDFREFSGLTPTQYLARATEHLNHVPLA